MTSNYTDYINTNILYAPGISTYSVKGDQGNDGKNGTSMYFCPCDLSIDENMSNIIEQISSNNSLYTNTQKVVYNEFDLFVDTLSNIYLLTISETEYKLTHIGNMRAYPKIEYKIVNNKFTSLTFNDNIKFDVLSINMDIIDINIESGYTIPDNAAFIRERDYESGEISLFQIHTGDS